MCYMIEGESSKTFNKARKFLHQNLEASSQLLQQMTDLIIDYLVLQVQAGAQVMIFIHDLKIWYCPLYIVPLPCNHVSLAQFVCLL